MEYLVLDQLREFTREALTEVQDVCDAQLLQAGFARSRRLSWGHNKTKMTCGFVEGGCKGRRWAIEFGRSLWIKVDANELAELYQPWYRGSLFHWFGVG